MSRSSQLARRLRREFFDLYSLSKSSVDSFWLNIPQSGARKSRRELIDWKVYRSIQGFTMIEIIVVIVVFGILAAALLVSVPSYFSRRRDAQRKADLHNMKFAFEDYMNDKSCYPPANEVQSCASTALSPYLRKVPCDPKTNSAYTYVLSADCQGFQIYTNLENATDADVDALGCTTGCGPSKAYNYGVVGGNALFDR